MRRVVRLVALLVAAVALMGAAEPKTSLPDLEDEVMCLTCGTSLQIANGPAADSQRAVINRLVEEGLTKEQVLDRLVEEYGPEVLATPEGSGFDLAAYAIPTLLVLVGLGGILVLARRWSRRPRPPAEKDDAAALDEDDERRLQAALAEYD